VSSRKKKSYARNFKEKHGKLHIVEKVKKCRFQKKYELPVSSIPQNTIANNRENDHVSVN